MKINKNYEGLKEYNYYYLLDKDLLSDNCIEIELDKKLFVKGSIIAITYIEAGEGIKAGGYIGAGESIEAGWDIEAGEGIKAGGGIESGTFIYCEKRIFAGLSIYKISQDCIKTIKCAELRKGEVCYGDLIITEQKGGGSDA